jgi:hypothetical protein
VKEEEKKQGRKRGAGAMRRERARNADVSTKA